VFEIWQNKNRMLPKIKCVSTLVEHEGRQFINRPREQRKSNPERTTLQCLLASKTRQNTIPWADNRIAVPGLRRSGHEIPDPFPN
jgi:hypothetical protein